ncbi:hypothetical protein GZ77_03270 [Endozoicomonas montiporae]|uniref:Uncharacterized protein n=2 Tax=Endozoicomonas montiporae TaxID=1027273 RepID=A0A081NB05_9GAMM|nr:hypothetical protein [Endozoicomonas montiporae]AMO56670.1 hypothetical protein EZMO1_2598 [Endozoicomonas montiporae CL-33]KEQ15628.1 hypothetical protein GZ77_03270 [Endozoicomonas montiporae]
MKPLFISYAGKSVNSLVKGLYLGCLYPKDFKLLRGGKQGKPRELRPTKDLSENNFPIFRSVGHPREGGDSMFVVDSHLRGNGGNAEVIFRLFIS